MNINKFTQNHCRLYRTVNVLQWTMATRRFRTEHRFHALLTQDYWL